MKKYNYVPDMIVIEGPEAGGHLGFKNEDLLQQMNVMLQCGSNVDKIKEIVSVHDLMQELVFQI